MCYLCHHHLSPYFQDQGLLSLLFSLSPDHCPLPLFSAWHLLPFQKFVICSATLSGLHRPMPHLCSPGQHGDDTIAACPATTIPNVAWTLVSHAASPALAVEPRYRL